jgi:Trypsin-co-occurring domain 1
VPKRDSDWKASIFVPSTRAAAPSVQDESVELHSIRSLIFGRIESVDPDAMKDQWQKTLDLLMGLSSSLSQKDKRWAVEEVEIGLTLSAKGELLFIAEAGAEASVKIKLVRK